MPFVAVGVALVAAEIITVTTLSYIALGATVVGMVTKNEKLLKIGSQLGIAAGVSSIATSFMTEAATQEAIKTGADVAGEEAANIGAAAPSGQEFISTAGETAAVPSGTIANQAAAETANAAASTLRTPETTLNAPAPAPATTPPPETLKAPGPEGVPDIGAKTAASTELPGPKAVETAAGKAGEGGDSLTGPFKKDDNNWFKFLDKDINKYLAMEAGKIAMGGIQGLGETDRANAQLAEKRRIEDLQRQNLAASGKSNYQVAGLMTRYS